MFYAQIIPLTKGMRVAGHLDENEDISYDWESGVAYDFNTVVWSNGSPYVSIRNVPDNAGAPETEPDFWGMLALNS